MNKSTTIGETHCNLTITSDPYYAQDTHKRRKKVNLVCKCGRNFAIYVADWQRSSSCRSCAATKHGMSKHPLYITWDSMIQRCSRKKRHNYSSYGGRGIKVVSLWLDFNNFKDWAFANGYKKELSLDRIDVNGNYEPSNCRWIEPYKQQWNKRNSTLIMYEGELKPVSVWARDPRCQVSKTALQKRLKNKWDVKSAIETISRNKSLHLD